MITRLHINKYKCLRNENMEFRPLTVLAGTNSSGKSSVLQAILLLARNCNPRNRERMYDLISKHQELHCDVSLTLDSSTYHYRTGNPENSQADILRIENSLYFLGANRMGMTSVLLDWSPRYDMTPADAGQTPDHIVHSPREWVGLIERIERALAAD